MNSKILPPPQIPSGATLMNKKPVAIIIGLILLFAGLFKCDAFSAKGNA